MPIKVVDSLLLSFSLIFVCRDMCVQDQEDLVLSKAYPKITPAANSCVCVWAVCLHRHSDPDGYEGLLFQPGAGAQQFSTEQMGWF